MSEPVPSPERPRPRFRRGWILLVVGALGVGLVLWLASGNSSGVQRRLDAIQAAGEPVDLVGLDAWIGAIPDRENGAPRIVTLLDGVRGVDLKDAPERVSSWPPKTLKWAEGERTRLRPVREGLHMALQASRYRYPLVVTNGTSNLGIQHLFPIRNGSRILGTWAGHSAAMGLQDDSADALLDSLRLARTLDNEALLISWLVRTACLTIAVDWTEKSLTLSPFPPARLAELQAAFRDAQQPRALARALAAERAYGNDVFKVSPAEYVKMMNPPLMFAGGTGPSNFDMISQTLTQIGYRLCGGQQTDHAFYLDTTSSLVEIARMEGPTQLTSLLQLEARFDKESQRWNRHRSRALGESLFNVVRKDQRLLTLLRSAETACAMERYRLAKGGRLPTQLADLIPEFLSAIPMDPASGNPLQFRARPVGYVVYGIGLDGKDNDGNETRKLGAGHEGWDFTFTVDR